MESNVEKKNDDDDDDEQLSEDELREKVEARTPAGLLRIVLKQTGNTWC